MVSASPVYVSAMPQRPLSKHVGAVKVGRLADLVLWELESFGAKPEMVLKSGVIAWPQVSFQFLPFNLLAPFHRESCFFVVCGANRITGGCSIPQCEHDLERLLDPATFIGHGLEEVDKVLREWVDPCRIPGCACQGCKGGIECVDSELMDMGAFGRHWIALELRLVDYATE